MIKFSEDTEDLNFAEALIGTFKLKGNTLVVEAENIYLMGKHYSEGLPRSITTRIIYEGVEDLTTNFEASRKIPLSRRECVGGNVINRQLWFEAWFAFEKVVVYVPESDFHITYSGVEIDGY